MSDVARICSIITFHLSKLWRVKFSILCDVIFLVRLQGNFDIDHSQEWKGYWAPNGKFEEIVNFQPRACCYAPSKPAVHISNIRKSQFSCCVHLKLDHNALRSCNHNDLRHLSSLRHVLHHTKEASFFRINQVSEMYSWEANQKFWLKKCSNHYLSIY